MRIMIAQVFICLLFACEDTTYLEQIYMTNDWNQNGILFLTESANVTNISDDSLGLYLTKEEKLQALDSASYQVDRFGSNVDDYTDSIFISLDTQYYRKVCFKNYGQVYKNNRFKIYTIFENPGSEKGRCYRYYLRTYDLDNQLIDSILFAVWDDDKGLFYSGQLTRALEINRLTQTGDLIGTYQISNEGRISMDKKTKIQTACNTRLLLTTVY